MLFAEARQYSVDPDMTLRHMPCEDERRAIADDLWGYGEDDLSFSRCEPFTMGDRIPLGCDRGLRVIEVRPGDRPDDDPVLLEPKG